MSKCKREYSRKFRSASACLDKARSYLESGNINVLVCDEIKTGLRWAIEGWLLKQGHIPDFGNGWHSMQAQFFGIAADPLRSKVSYCLARLVLLEGPETVFDGGTLTYKSPDCSSQNWRGAVKECMLNADTILAMMVGNVED